MDQEITKSNEGNIPLYQTTWDLDRQEGSKVNDTKRTHTQPFRDVDEIIPANVNDISPR